MECGVDEWVVCEGVEWVDDEWAGLDAWVGSLKQNNNGADSKVK